MTKQGKSGVNRRRSAPLDAAIKLAKSLRGREGVYGMLDQRDGRVFEVGVYNYTTKKYALYRSDMVDDVVLAEMREVAGL